MTRPQITVDVDAAGNVKVSASGFVGTGCAAATKAIEQAIGVTSADRKTPEYFAAQQAGQVQKASAGA